MIVEAILNLFLSFVSILIDGLPTMDFSQTVLIFDTFFDYVDMAAYFVPMDTITGILSVLIAEEMFKIGISIVKLILSFIPLMGG